MSEERYEPHALQSRFRGSLPRTQLPTPEIGGRAARFGRPRQQALPTRISAMKTAQQQVQQRYTRQLILRGIVCAKLRSLSYLRLHCATLMFALFCYTCGFNEQLKIRRGQPRGGSSPPPGTKVQLIHNKWFSFAGTLAETPCFRPL